MEKGKNEIMLGRMGFVRGGESGVSIQEAGAAGRSRNGRFGCDWGGRGLGGVQWHKKAKRPPWEQKER